MTEKYSHGRTRRVPPGRGHVTPGTHNRSRAPEHSHMPLRLLEARAALRGDARALTGGDDARIDLSHRLDRGDHGDPVLLRPAVTGEVSWMRHCNARRRPRRPTGRFRRRAGHSPTSIGD